MLAAAPAAAQGVLEPIPNPQTQPAVEAPVEPAAAAETEESVAASPETQPAPAPLRGFSSDVPDGTTVRRVDVRGLSALSEAFVRRTIKTRESQTFRESEVQEDVRALLASRKFLNVVAEAALDGDQAVVSFTLDEKPQVSEIVIEGNSRFKTEELLKELGFAVGDVLDQFQVQTARDEILRKYREKGYYYAEVALDESALASGRVVLAVSEGPRVKVRRVAFEGVRAFSEVQLRFLIKTQSAIWILRSGAFDEEVADRDALDLQTFYRNEGFLDARVGYRLDFGAVDRSDLVVTFVVEEGVRYTVESVEFEGATAFDDERLRSTVVLLPGEFARNDSIKADTKRLDDLYGEIGYVEADVRPALDFQEAPGVVRLRFRISEGLRSRFGRITIRGNSNTKDEVVRRELRFFPGEDYNTVKATKAEQRLRETTLFSSATITPLPDVNGEREALVEVEEAQTANFLFGFGVSTDSGLIGNFGIEQRNFDLWDWPRNWGQLFRGRAFRGDGQRLRISIEPGLEVSRFRISFTEPYAFDRPIRYDHSLYLFSRERDSYDEERIGFTPSLGYRFEDGILAGWAIEGALRLERVDIGDVRGLAARDIKEVRGESFLSTIKGTIVRDTTDSVFAPSEGYRLSMSWEQAFGEYSFSKPSGSFSWYRTVSTDDYDRKSVLALRGDAGFITGDAPVFERFYGGGFGSIRGFRFRGISPREGLFNDRVGGDFILLAGTEYSFPLYAETVRGVAFLDMGTVEKEFGIESWRASVGFGLRINVNFFGPVPIVLDVGFPIASDEDDDTQVFNFSFGASW